MKEWIRSKYGKLYDRAEKPPLFDIALFKEGRCIYSYSDELMYGWGE